MQDAGKDMWVKENDLPSARDSLAAATLGSRIYVLGGCSSGSVGRLATVESLDPREVRDAYHAPRRAFCVPFKLEARTEDRDL